MTVASKRKIVDVHLHFYDHQQNRHEFLDSEDKVFHALVGDYSSLPRTYRFDDYLADFSGEFHDLRRAKRFAACLDPASYVSSQTLAEKLLENGFPGALYPSVRHRRGTCLACFDPKRVANVRRGARFRFSWRGKPAPEVIQLAVSRKVAKVR